MGNVIKSNDGLVDEANLVLVVTDESKHIENHLITTILFKPKFVIPPLAFEGNHLRWLPENNFVGDDGSRFKVHLELEHECQKAFEAEVTDVNAELASLDDFPNGQYPYSVALKKKSLFAVGVESEIYKGVLTKGEPNEFVFKGKEILLGNCMCWDFNTDSLKQVFVSPECGILTNLIYQGISCASGETVASPCYSATMYYTTRSGERRPFNSENRHGFEIVNPVKVWVLNEHFLILRCTTDDAVCIDKRFSSIVNRSPNTIMSKDEQKERIEIPDYFEYKIR